MLSISIIFTGGSVTALAQTQKPDYSNLIVEELEQYRTEYSKTYLRNDGSLEAVVSASPLHFKELGAWVDYDNTLELDEDEGIYKNKKAPFSVELPDSTNNNKKITITKDGFTVELKLLGAKGVKAKKSEKVKATKAERKTMSAKEILNEDVTNLDKIEYAEIYDNTTVEYEVDSKSVKENIILNNSPKKAVSYTYQIRAEGMQIEKRTNGSIWFYPEEDAEKQNPIFYIPIPFMYDSNDEYSYDIETNLEIKNKKATLTYTPSFEWLTDSNRAYPVTVDPTVTMHNGMHDGYTYSATEKQDAILGFEDQLKVGKSAWLSDCDYFETYIKFDNLPEFPENYRLLSSSIMLTPKKSCGTWSEFVVGAFEITENWQNVYTPTGETCLTYTNRPDTATTATSLAYFDYNFIGCPEAIDVTELTKAWYSGEKDNNGVKLSMVNETNDNWDSMIYHSSRDIANAPYLSVVFADTTIDCEKIEIINLPKNNKLYVGNKHRLETLLYPSQILATNIIYASSNHEVAKVDENGVIEALSPGTTQIVAIDNETGLTDNFTLTVYSAPIKYFECKVPTGNTIKLGETFQITNMPDVTLMARTPGVVAIDNNKGTVRGIGVGMTVIEYVRPGWTDFKSFDLCVTEEIDFGSILPEKIYTGDSFTVYKPSFIGYQYEVEFLTNNSSIAYFSGNEDNTVFEFHALKPGTVNVVFKCQELNLYDQTTITIKENIVDSIELATGHPEYSVLYIGESVDINATVLPTTAYNKELEWGLSEWDVVECNVYEDNSRKVKITAKTEGEVVLYAFATDGSGVVGEFNITVVKPNVTILNPSNVTLQTGDIYELKYSTKGPVELYKWEINSDVNGIATIFGNSLVPNRAGTLSIKAIVKNMVTGDKYCSASIDVTIYEFYIIDNPKNDEIFLSSLWDLNASLNNIETNNITWDSGDDSIATVDANGNVIGVSEGTVTITAIWNNHSSITATIDITVTETYSYFIYRYDASWRVNAAITMIANQFYNGNQNYVEAISVFSANDIAEQWNSLGDDGRKIGYVILNVHGNPFEITPGGIEEGEEESTSLSREDISNLEHKDIYGLALCVCNAGHLDYANYNVATEFAKIVEFAPVVASDGTEEFDKDGNLDSLNDDVFRDWSDRIFGEDQGRTQNDGWIIYQDTGSSVEIERTGERDLTLQALLGVLYEYT